MKITLLRNTVFLCILWLLLSFSVLFAQTPAGTVIENAAFVAYNDLGGYGYQEQSDTVLTTVGPGYRLALTKRVDKIVCMPSDTLNYSLEIMNSGNSYASDVTITDTLPPELGLLEAEPHSSLNGQILSWSFREIAPGTSRQMNISCIVVPDVSEGSIVENHAVFLTNDGIKGKSMRVETLIDSKPFLNLETSVNKLTAYAGDTLKYVIETKNSGNAPARDTRVYSQISDALIFISSSHEENYEDKIASFSMGTIMPNQTVSLEINTLVKYGIPHGTLIVNTVSAFGPQTNTVTDELVTQIIDRTEVPEFGLQRNSRSEICPADTFDYSLVYSNNGNGPSTETILTENLDPELIFIHANNHGIYNEASHSIIWDLDTLAQGIEDSSIVRVAVKKGLNDGTVIENSSEITCFERFHASESFDMMVTAPEFEFQKTCLSDTVSAGNEIHYRLSYRNSGSSDADKVLITDTLSENVTYDDSQSGMADYNATDHVLIWNFDDLPGDMSQSDIIDYHVTTLVPLQDRTVIHNSAQILCRQGNSATAKTAVLVRSHTDLSLNKSADHGAYMGDTIRYVISCANQGNATAESTVLYDTLSPCFEFISADASYEYDSEKHCVSWNLGDFLPTESYSFNLFGRIVEDDDLVLDEIFNRAYLHTADTVLVSDSVSTTVYNRRISMSAYPDTILGNGNDYSEISVDVEQVDGSYVEDGTRVRIWTAFGEFENRRDTITKETVNSNVMTSLRSEAIESEYLQVPIGAYIIDEPEIKANQEMVFSAVRINGVVRDDNGDFIEGAIVTIILDGEIVGTAVTDSNGQYSIAVYESGNYTIRIEFTDNHGETGKIEKSLDVDTQEPDSLGRFDDLCSLSGRLIDYNSYEPLRVNNIPVVIDIANNTSALNKSGNGIFPDTTYTDTSGFWSFSNLAPGRYQLKAVYEDENIYLSANRVAELVKPGQNTINVDLYQYPALFRIYKKVNKENAFSGDTLEYRIVYETMQNTVTDSIWIVDTLSENVQFLSQSIDQSECVEYDFDSDSRQLQFIRKGMSESKIDSISFKVRLNNGLSATIRNDAKIFSRADTAYTLDDNRSAATTKVMSPALSLSKTSNWKTAEMGDILTYTLTIKNRSKKDDFESFTVHDVLPFGFRFRESRSFLDGEKIADPVITIQNKRQVLEWNINHRLSFQSEMKLKYRVTIGLESGIGENVNEAQVTVNMPGGYQIESNSASAEVLVKPSMMQDKGLIFGKVFFDLNKNSIQDNGEEGLQGIEIITEEGIRIVTDEYGKYSIPNVRKGYHVLRINKKTLPAHTMIAIDSPEFLGHRAAKMVKVSWSGMEKANFSVREIDQNQSDKLDMTETGIMDIHQDIHENRQPIQLFQPLSIDLRYNYTYRDRCFILKNNWDLQKIADLLMWQDHLQIDIHDHSGYKNDSNENISTSMLAPGKQVRDYMLKSGIKSERIQLFSEKQSRTKGLILNRKCVVTVGIKDARLDSLKENEFILTYHLNYSGAKRLRDFHLVTLMPSGFKLDETSMSLNGSDFQNVSLNSQQIIWNLGNWKWEKQADLFCRLIPHQLAKINNDDQITSFISYQGKGNRRVQSPAVHKGTTCLYEKVYVSLGACHLETSSGIINCNEPVFVKKLADLMAWRKDVSLLLKISGGKGIVLENDTENIRNFFSRVLSISTKKIQIKVVSENSGISNTESRSESLDVEVYLIPKLDKNDIKQSRQDKTKLKLHIGKDRMTVINNKAVIK